MGKKNKMLTIIATTLILLICFFVGLYALGIRSEPFRFALKFIDNNKTLIERVGALKNRRLAFFGYSVRYSGPNGHADYKVLVKGKQAEGTVYLKLQKSVGEWKVLKANLKLADDEIIPLTD